MVGRPSSKPFDVAQNTDGNIYVTANGDDQVYGFQPDGRAAAGIAVR